jgi:hypothetical protein
MLARGHGLEDSVAIQPHPAQGVNQPIGFMSGSSEARLTVAPAEIGELD